MVRIDAVLVALAVASALGVVASQHQARRLHGEYEREQARAQALEVEWGQLQLEQSTWAVHSRIEQIAASQLQMRVPEPARVKVIQAGGPH